MSAAAPVRAARRRPVLVGTLAAVAVAGLGPLAAAPASAHDYVVSSNPADGAVVDTVLDEVSYTFNAPILDLSGTGTSNVVEVVGPDGRHHETACAATVAGPTATVPVALGGPGTYTSTYQVVSSDGHTVSASQTFEYAPPAGAPAAPGSDERPSCDAAPPSAATEGEPEGTMTTQVEAGSEATDEAGGDAAAGDDAGGDDATGTAAGEDAEVSTGVVVGVAAAIVVLALVAVGVVLVTARRRGGPGADSTDGAAARSADGTDDVGAAGTRGPRD